MENEIVLFESEDGEVKLDVERQVGDFPPYL